MGYVSESGTGNVASGVSIYSDVDLQTLAETSTGANASYTGDREKSTVGTLQRSMLASSEYNATVAYTGTNYSLILNSAEGDITSSR